MIGIRRRTGRGAGTAGLPPRWRRRQVARATAMADNGSGYAFAEAAHHLAGIAAVGHHDDPATAVIKLLQQRQQVAPPDYQSLEIVALVE